jgi:HK97 family phage portal protein
MRGTRGMGSHSEGGADLAREVSARIDNSVVYPAVLFATKAILEAPIVVKRPGAGGKLEVVPNHPITELLNKPNPWYGGATLLQATIVAQILGGQGYWLKHRSGARKIIGLEYLPLGAVWPESIPGSGNFIDLYRVRLQTGPKTFLPDDVVRLTWHVVNPWRPALAVGPLEACLPEIAADRRASRYEHGILRNTSKAHVLSPRGQDALGQPLTFGETQREDIQTWVREMGSGDAVGSVGVWPYPMDVSQIGFSPADMALEHQHNLSEERVAACIGIPAVLLGFGTGLENSSNRAQLQSARLQGAQQFTIPLMQSLARQLTEDLVPELGLPGDVVEFLTDQIPVIREAREESDAAAAGNPHKSVNEVREAKGLPPVPGGDRIKGVDDSTDSKEPAEGDDQGK